MINDKLEALKEAIVVLGTQEALAGVCGRNVRQQHVWNWLNRPGKNGVPTGLPEKYALRVQAATKSRGQMVTAERLCPEMFDINVA